MRPTMTTSSRRDGDRTTPIRVVVASRDRVYAASLARQFADVGIVVTQCMPGEECESVAEDIGRADVLVMESDGSRDDERALLARVRALSPLVEVIAISAKTAVVEAVRGFRSGLFAVLELPVASEELVATVTDACRRKRRAEDRIRELDRAGNWQPRGSRSDERTPGEPPHGKGSGT